MCCKGSIKVENIKGMSFQKRISKCTIDIERNFLV